MVTVASSNLSYNERVVLREALEQYLFHIRDRQWTGDPDALISCGDHTITYRDAEEIVKDLLEKAAVA